MRVKRYSYTGDGEIIQAMEKKNVLKPIAVNVIPLFIYRSVCHLPPHTPHTMLLLHTAHIYTYCTDIVHTAYPCVLLL